MASVYMIQAVVNIVCLALPAPIEFWESKLANCGITLTFLFTVCHFKFCEGFVEPISIKI